MGRPRLQYRDRWGSTRSVKTTGDSRIKAKKRGNKRRQKRVDRQRQFNEDRRSGAAQKRRQRLYRSQMKAMEKARKKRVTEFFNRLADPQQRVFTAKEKWQQAERARHQMLTMEREVKRRRDLIEERKRERARYWSSHTGAPSINWW